MLLIWIFLLSALVQSIPLIMMKKNCDSPINVEEIKEAIILLKNNKSARNYGITAEFFFRPSFLIFYAHREHNLF